MENMNTENASFDEIKVSFKDDKVDGAPNFIHNYKKR